MDQFVNAFTILMVDKLSLSLQQIFYNKIHSGILASREPYM